MKKIFLSIIFVIVLFSSAFADVYVKPYYKSNGTYVQGHYRSSPDSTTSNNWSTTGNTNPYTGKSGTNSVGSSTFGGSSTFSGSCSALSLSC
tara:strand:- start:272 stop:547 length:276 start_codon:yes stop_codon:yes gene_type:complete